MIKHAIVHNLRLNEPKIYQRIGLTLNNGIELSNFGRGLCELLKYTLKKIVDLIGMVLMRVDKDCLQHRRGKLGGDLNLGVHYFITKFIIYNYS